HRISLSEQEGFSFITDEVNRFYFLNKQVQLEDGIVKSGPAANTRGVFINRLVDDGQFIQRRILTVNITKSSTTHFTEPEKHKLVVAKLFVKTYHEVVDQGLGLPEIAVTEIILRCQLQRFPA